MSVSKEPIEKIGGHTHAQAEPYNLLGKNRLNVTHDYVFFANLNLDTEALETALLPYMDLVSQRIGFTYKSATKISFQGISGIFKLRLSDWLQFDDVCIKLLHVESGSDVLVTVSTQIARSMLIRLLSTTLVDDTHGVLFSSTEKGIFGFIIARLLLDLKQILGDKMPDLKLLGVYHCQDESIDEMAIADYGVFNFSFGLAHEYYPVSFALPVSIFNTIKQANREFELLKRCGHIRSHLTFTLKTLSMTQSGLAKLSFGDLIIFDHAQCTYENARISGALRGEWHGIVMNGSCELRGADYVFVPDFSSGFSRNEDNPMEEVEIIGALNNMPANDKNSRKLADLAKNIRVPLSIELSRIPLTLKELCQIREGQIIDLHRKIDDPLDMVVEGKVIGYCQPVQIDGRLGIRVLSIDGDAEDSRGQNSDASPAA